MRCLEQLRVCCAMMRLPVTLVGVGAGLGYDEAGPTHHATEEIAALRALPGFVIHSVSDAVMAADAALRCLSEEGPSYVRLDRLPSADLYAEGHDFSQGFSALKKNGPFLIAATGAMTHAALSAASALERQGTACGVIDVYRFPCREEAIVAALDGVRKIVTVEEHFLAGGLGSMLCELISDRGLGIPVRRLGLDGKMGYFHGYGGRETVRKHYGLDAASIELSAAEFFREA
jgi:transketolase